MCFAAGALSGMVMLAQDAARGREEAADEIAVEHADCENFRPDTRAREERRKRDAAWRSRITEEVALQLSPAGPSKSTRAAASSSYSNLIDRHIFAELERQSVRPAAKTTDAEFLRRVSLDLTGRIPTRERTIAFLNDPATDKRARYVEELLVSSAYVDKWTMYFGDLFKNTQRNQNITRYEQGRNAFYNWIKESVEKNKPYNQMASELISAAGTNSWTQGELNWLVGYRVTGGPAQDIYDQQTVAVAETFLGLGHLNCVLCHDGRGHLDTLSLWGKTARRYEAWELASFLSRTNVTRVGVTTGNVISYWGLADVGRNDYTLNTTTGNRPARVPLANGARTVPPRYIFSDRRPASGEPYRVSLAREVTADPQFARAAVNYLWAEFFTRGLVEPVNQFDLARLDPDNPPPAPWTLQPSHPRLLKELSEEFAKNGYDLKWLMRTIVNSEAYQLSSRYEGTWNVAWEPLFARKLVRRLWAEEIHDSIAVAGNIFPTYRVSDYSGDNPTTRGTRDVRFAMQLPEPAGAPDGANGAVSQFLDSFYRGNRDEDERSREGSVQQALNLMNDSFVMTRVRASGTGANASLLRTALATNDNAQIVEHLYLAVLSRAPSAEERTAAVKTLESVGLAARQSKAEDLLWSLFNKVDFVFNY
ncbi:MAG: DUF1553 domain-containing protein [Bryobacteraceae bacterium]|nr:DUF1553 domain-containing protein [Bryobacteraceae bacterium]